MRNKSIHNSKRRKNLSDLQRLGNLDRTHDKLRAQYVRARDRGDSKKMERIRREIDQVVNVKNAILSKLNPKRKRNISGELILLNPDIRAKIQRLKSQAMKLQADRRRLGRIRTDGAERKLDEVDRKLQGVYVELKSLEKGAMKNKRNISGEMILLNIKKRGWWTPYTKNELVDLQKLRKLPRASKRVLIKSLRNRGRKNQSDTIKIEGVDYQIVGEIPGQVTEIKYDRVGDTEHPGKYFHKFDTPTEILALEDGSIVIVPKSKKKLWEEI